MANVHLELMALVVRSLLLGIALHASSSMDPAMETF